MALDPRDFLRPKGPKVRPDDVAGPGTPLAGTRKQRIQRLQVGLFGLASMVLLVGLSNLVLTSAQQTQATAVPDAAPTVSTEDVPPPPPRDPLADAGVVPDLPAEPDPGSESSQQQTTPPENVDVPPVPIE